LQELIIQTTPTTEEIVMNEFVLIVAIVTSIWVYFDAKKIGVRKGLMSGIADMNPGMWLFACLFLWIVAFPIYLIKRADFKKALAGTMSGNDSGMVFCRGCGKKTYSSALTCPQCGAKQ
jgi:hypothetical protein